MPIAQDGNYCAMNPKFIAVVVEVGGGGSFDVLPLSAHGRVGYNVWKVTGHAGPVLDVKWNPFNDNTIASGSEDCRIRVWITMWLNLRFLELRSNFCQVLKFRG